MHPVYERELQFVSNFLRDVNTFILQGFIKLIKSDSKNFYIIKTSVPNKFCLLALFSSKIPKKGIRVSTKILSSKTDFRTDNKIKNTLKQHIRMIFEGLCHKSKFLNNTKIKLLKYFTVLFLLYFVAKLKLFFVIFYICIFLDRQTLYNHAT